MCRKCSYTDVTQCGSLFELFILSDNVTNTFTGYAGISNLCKRVLVEFMADDKQIFQIKFLQKLFVISFIFKQKEKNHCKHLVKIK